MGEFGDVPGLWRAAGDLKRLAGELDRLRARLGMLQGGLAGRWRGEAHDRFDQRVDDYRRDLDNLAGDAEAAGQVLGSLAEELGQAAWSAAERQLATLHPETSPLAMGLVIVGNAEKLRGLATARYDALAGAKATRKRLDTAYQEVRRARRATPRHKVPRPTWEAAVAREAAAKARLRKATSLVSRLSGETRLGTWLSANLDDIVKPMKRASVPIRAAGHLPVIGVLAAGAGTYADVRSGQVGWGAAVVGNFGGLAAGTAAGFGTGAFIAAAPVSVSATVAVGAVAVVGYGVGTAVHSLVTRGDLSEFKDDWNTLKSTVARWFD